MKRKEGEVEKTFQVPDDDIWRMVEKEKILQIT